METNKEIIDNIYQIIRNHPKYENGGVSMYKMGVKEREYPVVWMCSDICVRVSIVMRCSVYISVYRKGCNECGCSASYTDLPTTTLREVYKIVKKYFN